MGVGTTLEMLGMHGMAGAMRSHYVLGTVVDPQQGCSIFLQAPNLGLKLKQNLNAYRSGTGGC